MLQLFMVFVATVIVDWIWAWYIIYTAKKLALKASILAALISCLGSFVTLSYINDRRAIIAVALGAFVGTFLSIKFSKKEE